MKHKFFKKIGIIWFSIIIILAAGALFIRYSYAASGDGAITAAQPQDGSNYVHLDWSSTTGNHYMVHKKMEADNDYQTIPLKSKIKVLNIYPDKAGSDGCKSWMTTYGSPSGTGYTMELIDNIGTDAFNADPNKYLGTIGNYKYDVIYFGGYDSNNYQDLTNDSYNAVKAFVDYGGGCLLGHDTASFNHNYFISLAEQYLNMQVSMNNGAILPYGDTTVNISKKGYLMNYPYKLKNGNIGDFLSVPLTHTYYEFASGDVWFTFANSNFENGILTNTFNGKSGTNNFYLTTWNNMAMIQIGHSNGEATEDEQKILTNTLYYLSQVSTSTSFDDRTSQDLAAPNAVTGSSVIAKTGYDGKTVLTFDAPEDNGTSYSYYVQSFASSSSNSSTNSETTSATVNTGIKGYAIKIDQNSSDVDPGNEINATTTSFNAGALTAGNYYVHIKTIDNAGNVSSKITTVGFSVSIPSTPVLSTELSVLPDLDEDTLSDTGTTVADLLKDKVSLSDGHTYGIAITKADNSNGQWQYSINGSSWYSLPRELPDVSENNALLLPPTAKIRFSPASDYTGTSVINYRAWDTAFGANEGRADVSVNGASTAFSSQEGGAKITVNAVNDAPAVVRTDSAKALKFGGAATQFMTVPDMKLNGSFTVESWVYLNGNINWSRIFDFGNGSYNFNQLLAFKDSSLNMILEFYGSDSSKESNIVTSESFPLKQWVYVSAVYDYSTQTGYIYWNGVLKASGHMSNLCVSDTTRSDNYFGKSNWSQDSYFTGAMTGISIWNIAKSAEQIQSDMNSAPKGNENGLIAGYNLSEGSGATVGDCSSNGNNASLSNITWVNNSNFAYSASGYADKNIVLDKIMITDVDAADGIMELNLKALNGSLTITSFDNTQVTVSNNKSSDVTIRGTENAINLALKSLVYKSSISGSDTVTATVSDLGNTGIGGALTATADISVTVKKPLLPGAPTDLSATVGDGQAVVSFTAPVNDGGADITGYTATAVPTDGGTVVTAAASGSAITINGLKNGKTYQITVSAMNAAGTGAASDPIIVVMNAAAPIAGSGYSMSFDGTDGYIDIPKNAVFTTNAFTVEAWIQYDTDQKGYKAIIDKGRNSYKNWYILTPDADGSRGVIAGIQGGDELHYYWNNSDWNHVAITYDGNKFCLYVDGVLRDSETVDSNKYIPVDTNITFGRRQQPDETPGGNLSYFQGKLDEVQIWSNARSQDDINKDRFRHPAADESGLLGYWNLDDSTGKTAYDSSINKLNGNLTNMDAASSRSISQAWVNRTTGINKPIAIAAGYDPNGGSITIAKVSDPSHGILAINNSVLTYTPNKNWYGSDEFTYRVANSINKVQNYTVKMNVINTNNAPNRIADVSAVTGASIKLGDTYSLDLSKVFEDKDGDQLTYKVSAASGSAIAVEGNIYTCTPDKAGQIKLVFTAFDGIDQSSDTYTVNLLVNTIPGTIPGAGTGTTAVIKPGETYQLDLSKIFQDADGGGLTYKVSVNGAEAVPADQYYTYTQNVTGKVKLVFTATDGINESSDTYTVNLTVNTAPNRIADDSAVTGASIKLGDTYSLDLSKVFEDKDGDQLTYKVSAASGSAIAVEGNIYTFTPNKAGSTCLVFTAYDGIDYSADTYTVNLSINTIPTRAAGIGPTANATIKLGDTYQLDLSKIFKDADGNGLTYQVSAANQGAVPVSGSTFTYQPNKAGSISFVFTASDGTDSSADTYTVNLLVNTIPGTIPGAGTEIAAAIKPGETYQLDLSKIFQDADGGGLTYKVSVNGAEAVPADQYYTYTQNSTGKVTLVFTASDGINESSNTYTVNLTVNTAPAIITGATETNVKMKPGEAYHLDLSTIFNDADGGMLNYKVSVNGAAAIPAEQNYSYLPDKTGPATLVFTASDGINESSDTYTVNLVTNTAPGRKAGVNAVSYADITLGDTYFLDLSTIFEDKDQDALTYQAVVSGSAIAVTGKNFSYTPSVTGSSIVIVFKANDGTDESVDTYTVNLSVAGNISDVSLDGIDIVTPPVKTEYLVGDHFDPTGLAVSASYSDGSRVPLNSSQLTFNGFDSSVPVKNQMITVEYNNKTTGFLIHINAKDTPDPNQNPDQNSAPKLRVGVNALSYVTMSLGDTYNLDLSSIFEDADGDNLTYQAAVSGSAITVTGQNYLYTPAVTGSSIVIVFKASDGKDVSSDSYTVVLSVGEKVPDVSLDSISITSAPIKTEYFIGDNFDSSGLTVAAVYSDGSRVPISNNLLLFSGFNSSIPNSNQVITVCYGNKTTSYIISIKQKIVDKTNTVPNRRASASASQTILIPINTAYNLNLSEIFEDADQDPLTYKAVSNGVTSVWGENYSFTSASNGTFQIVFTANDGKADSNDSFNLTIQVFSPNIPSGNDPSNSGTNPATGGETGTTPGGQTNPTTGGETGTTTGGQTNPTTGGETGTTTGGQTNPTTGGETGTTTGGQTNPTIGGKTGTTPGSQTDPASQGDKGTSSNKGSGTENNTTKKNENDTKTGTATSEGSNSNGDTKKETATDNSSEADADAESQQGKTLEIVETPQGMTDTKLISVTAQGDVFDESVEVRLREDSANEKAIRDIVNKENPEVADNLIIYPLDIGIYIKNTDIKVQPKEGTSVQITLPIPEQLLQYKDSLYVAFLLNGKIKILPSKIVKKDNVYCVAFSAVHFSPYALLVDKENKIKSIVNKLYANEKSAPKTGENSDFKFIIIICDIICIAILLFLRRKEIINRVYKN